MYFNSDFKALKKAILSNSEAHFLQEQIQSNTQKKKKKQDYKTIL